MSRTKRAEMDMIHGSIWNKIPQFALPIAATAILGQLFNASDLAVVGNFTGEARNACVAAVSSNSAIVSLVGNFFVGIGLGAQTGIFVTGVAGTHSLLSRAVVALILGAVMLYTLFSIRDFGFDKTIASVEKDAPAPVVVEVQYEDRIAARCQELAVSHGLTERETDVFGLLARGNNTLRIQEELSITKNTLKYHTRHIYEKLGVHSQQELIDLL